MKRFIGVFALLLAVPAVAAAQSASFTLTGYPAGTGFNFPERAALGDMNGDGNLDVVVSDGSGPSVLRVLFGTGTGGFGPSVGLPISGACPSNTAPTCASNTYQLRVVDVNGDSKADIVAANNFSHNLTVVLSNGNGTFGTPMNYPMAYEARTVNVGDFNGDGIADLIGADTQSAGAVFLGVGGGTFGPAIPFADGGLNRTDIAVADFNGDGRADAVLTNRDSNDISVFLGNGLGGLTANARYGFGGSAQAVAVGDFNKDSRPDVAVANSGGFAEVFLNTGGGALAPAVGYAAGSTPVSIIAADFNVDGNLDLALANQDGNNYSVLLGDGAGAFGPPANYPSPTNTSVLNLPKQVMLGDLNNDGKKDVILVSRQTRSIVTMVNTTVPALPTKTLTILGGVGQAGDVAANVEYFNPATQQWQPAYLVGPHPWGQVSGTSSWINYKPSNGSDPGAGPAEDSTLWYLYRVRFTVPEDAIAPQMSFSLKADNFAQVAINGALAGGSTQIINNAPTQHVIVGEANGFIADAVFSQAVHAGENTITINMGDYGGLNGFNFRIDLTMRTNESLEIVPATPQDSTAPVITAPADITAEATSDSGASVSFNASATDDVDGPVPVDADPASGTTFPLGNTTVTLSATDAAGNNASASFVVTVQDTTAPVVTAPASIVAEATSASGATVTYPDATATDAVGVTSIDSTPASGSVFALGTTTVTATARDNAGNTGAANFTVSVVDTTAPSLSSVAPSTGSLWPPNHKMVAINITASSSDLVGVTSMKVISVTSSEPDNGLGDGDTAGDTVITGPMSVSVRAERSGNGNGRTYTITVEARDAAGNSTRKTCTVVVPHSQGK